MSISGWGRPNKTMLSRDPIFRDQRTDSKTQTLCSTQGSKSLILFSDSFSIGGDVVSLHCHFISLSFLPSFKWNLQKMVLACGNSLGETWRLGWKVLPSFNDSVSMKWRWLSWICNWDVEVKGNCDMPWSPASMQWCKAVSIWTPCLQVLWTFSCA